MRFLKKILTDAEIEVVQNAAYPDKTLWSFWACKEAAYKVIQKSFPAIAFIPRQWQTVLQTHQSGYSEGEVVISGQGGVYFRLFPEDDHIHCIGSDSLNALDNIIWRVEALPEEEDVNPSLFLRQCLAKDIARHFSLAVHQIKIQRVKQNGELQPPHVYAGRQKTNLDISLSHDGRFVAYTYHP